MANVFAQTEALAFGKTAEEVARRGHAGLRWCRTAPSRATARRTRSCAERLTPRDARHARRALRAQRVHAGRDLGHRLVRPVGRRAGQGAGASASSPSCKRRPSPTLDARQLDQRADPPLPGRAEQHLSAPRDRPRLRSMSEIADTVRQDLLRTVAAGTAGVVGERFLERLVQSVGAAFGGGVCWVSELVEDRPSARALACWPPAALPAGTEYALEGTPCQLLHERAVVSYESGTTAAFPQDTFLIEHGLDGYLAVTCPGADGRAIGYLAVTTQESLQAGQTAAAALQILRRAHRRGSSSAASRRRGCWSARRCSSPRARKSSRPPTRSASGSGATFTTVPNSGYRARPVPRRGRAPARRGDPDEARRLLAPRARAGRRGRRASCVRSLTACTGRARSRAPVALETLAMQSPLPLEVSCAAGPPPPRRRRGDDLLRGGRGALQRGQARGRERRCGSWSRCRTGSSGRRSPTTARAAPTSTPAPASSASAVAWKRSAAAWRSRPCRRRHDARAHDPVMPWRTPDEPFLQYGSPDDGGRGERLAAGILDGSVRVAVTLAREWNLEGGLRRIGTLLPVRDATGCATPRSASRANRPGLLGGRRQGGERRDGRADDGRRVARGPLARSSSAPAPRSPSCWARPTGARSQDEPMAAIWSPRHDAPRRRMLDLDSLLDEPLGVCTKGLPDDLAARRAGGGRRARAPAAGGDLLLPALTLRGDRLRAQHRADDRGSARSTASRSRRTARRRWRRSSSPTSSRPARGA